LAGTLGFVADYSLSQKALEIGARALDFYAIDCYDFIFSAFPFRFAGGRQLSKNCFVCCKLILFAALWVLAAGDWKLELDLQMELLAQGGWPDMHPNKARWRAFHTLPLEVLQPDTATTMPRP